jgi:hypothetical protein
MFGLGPAYMFILKHRLPVGLMRTGWQPWGSTMATNAAIVLLVGALMWLVGVGPFLLVHLPVALLAASIGLPGTRRRRPAHADQKPRMRALGPVGRDAHRSFVSLPQSWLSLPTLPSPPSAATLRTNEPRRRDHLR